MTGDQPSLLSRRHLTFTAPTIRRSANEAPDASRLLQEDGAPGEVRTRDPQIKSLVLLPAELLAQIILFVNYFNVMFFAVCQPTTIANMLSFLFCITSSCYSTKINAGASVIINFFVDVNFHFNSSLLVDSLGLEPRTTKLTNLRTLLCRVSGLAAPMLRKVLELFIQIPYTESLPILKTGSKANLWT